MNRLLTLTEGRAMVVTDLHGDWELYCKYRDHFFDLHHRGEANYLIFTGDLIHREGPIEVDKSLEIIQDVIQLKKQLGERLICLMGNHEMPHLYAITLQKGEIIYTPGFEARMGSHRTEIIAFFDSLPFFVRTQAGVSITHAGAATSLAQPANTKLIDNFSHRELWAKAEKLIPFEERHSLRTGFARLNRTTYDEMARELLAIYSPADPRYDDLLISSMVRVFPEFDILWETFFNKNEHEYGVTHYADILQKTLHTFSRDFVPQNFLISGHIICPDGHQIIAGKQLRLASGIHAKPFNSAKYLLFNAGAQINKTEDLISGVKNIF